MGSVLLWLTRMFELPAFSPHMLAGEANPSEAAEDGWDTVEEKHTEWKVDSRRSGPRTEYPLRLLPANAADGTQGSHAERFGTSLAVLRGQVLNTLRPVSSL